MADVGVPASQTVLTPRLEVRVPVEADRERFVQLFRDESFMVFSAGALDWDSAHGRFDEMLERAAELRSRSSRSSSAGQARSSGTRV